MTQFLVFLLQVLSSYVGRGKYRNKRRRRGGFLYIRTPLGLLTLYQAHYANDFESKLTRHLNRLNRRTACGADIVHDHHTRGFFSKAFDPLSRAMLLLSFADEKAVNLAAGDSHRHHDRIGPHG